jgi:hypothetical protein
MSQRDDDALVTKSYGNIGLLGRSWEQLKKDQEKTEKEKSKDR